MFTAPALDDAFVESATPVVENEPAVPGLVNVKDPLPVPTSPGFWNSEMLYVAASAGALANSVNAVTAKNQRLAILKLIIAMSSLSGRALARHSNLIANAGRACSIMDPPSKFCAAPPRSTPKQWVTGNQPSPIVRSRMSL